VLAWREFVNFLICTLVLKAIYPITTVNISRNLNVNHCESYLEEYAGSNTCVYGPCAVCYPHVLGYFQT
jgi:hypothetical protein